MHLQTRSIHTGVYMDTSYNSVATPIYATSTFYFDKLGKTRGYDYTRTANPTRTALEQNLADLEGGTPGGAAITTTGMAAITTTLFLFKSGDHLISGNDIYGGTHRLFTKTFKQMGIEFTLVDMRNPDNVRAAIRPNTKAIWIETPSNPLLNLVDIADMVKIAKEHSLLTIADNTFLSPYFQQPLALGVDVVVHSTTKYINGHSDVVGGAIIAKNPELAQQIKALANCLGTGCSPFDAFLVLRGVKTLAIRMREHAKNAQAIAEYLDQHPRVKHVYYPGLASHPQQELAKRQMSGFGGMLSFEIDTQQVDLDAFFAKLRLFRLAESLGGVESLIEQPWSMSHASMDEPARVASGITPGTIRVSVGLEDANDLIADLDHALAAADIAPKR